MPGFLGEISTVDVKKGFGESNKSSLINETIESQKYYLERRTIRKFENDKIFSEDDGYIIITEGVILNSLLLIEKYRTRDLKSTVVRMYEQNGDTFFNEFRGSFSGLLYDKIRNRWLIYTNHIGDKQIFYALLGNTVIFGSEMTYLIDYMRSNDINYTLDEVEAYFLLTYGYMLEAYSPHEGFG